MFLTISGLAKSFGDNKVLKDINLELDKGEVLSIIGPSGSGKTTLLRCFNGLETPDKGRMSFENGLTIDFGEKASKQSIDTMRKKSAMVFQSYNLFPHKTVLENVIEGPVIVQKEKRANAVERAEALLEKVGLKEKKDFYPHQLSGGQQQRVGIARALALKPELMLFDEPTSALDPELIGEVLTVMKDLAKEKWTMIMVTHEIQFAGEISDQIVFMDGGYIVEHGPPQEVLKAPKQERTKQFLQRILNPV
ncbi:amino acid ABC transporter ATP-binding protein [Mesobacillus maritimus]|uniref:Amino acid ABC transporter ATP-binding protein n=1 Tax=Mesobacillus maritimus TaxID=1643336 RepID=A0ABS7KAP9_9BACI|nr:amino acid ABC transporter ATP-binding protein [Mesobacillus maritimus]MBY0099195.1 amino acid ABC transporter ATP-binding protein [Mesobacillus maritimus]